MITEITLTPEQTGILQQAIGPIAVVDAAGKRVGEIAKANSSHFSPKELSEMEANLGKDGPYLTTPELLAKLQGMEAK